MLISIVVPVYNVEKYVSKCLKSVIEQMTEDVELIVINDGSTDSSLRICEEIIGEKESNIKLLSQDNQGLSATRNNGINMAAGKYIVFLDSDDELAAGAIPELLNSISNFPDTDIFYYDAKTIDEISDGKKRKTYDRKNKVPGFIQMSGLEYFKNYYVDTMIVSACLCAFRMELIKKKELCFDVGRLYEDNVFSFNALINSEKVCYIPKELYLRRYREYSITTCNKREKDIVDICFLIKRVMGYKKEILDFRDLILCNAYLTLIYKMFVWGYSESQLFQLGLKRIDDLIKCIYDEFEIWPEEYKGISYYLFMYYFLQKSEYATTKKIEETQNILREDYKRIFNIFKEANDKRIAIYGRGKHTDLFKNEYRKLQGETLNVEVYLDSFVNKELADDGEEVINIAEALGKTDLIILSSRYYRLEMLNTYNRCARDIPLYDFYETEKMDMFNEEIF